MGTHKCVDDKLAYTKCEWHASTLWEHAQLALRVHQLEEEYYCNWSVVSCVWFYNEVYGSIGESGYAYFARCAAS